MPIDRGLHSGNGGLLAPLLGPVVLLEMPALGEERGQFRPVRFGKRAGGRLDLLREAGQRPGIDWVGLR